LPGVRELFQSRKKEEEEENQVLAHYKRFMNQGPAYYGDLDEADGKLLTYEHEAEEEGKAFVLYVKACNLIRPSDWEESFINVREVFDLPPDTQVPELPRTSSSAKRKTADHDSDVEMGSGTEDSKRVKTISDLNVAHPTTSNAETARIHAQAAAAYITFLDVEHLLPPKLPTHDEMEGVLLALRKKALLEEYLGDAA
jgi:pre-mRNA-splicing factor ISY1